MAKMKNHDCPLGVSYVAIKAEKKKKTDWKATAWLIADAVIIAAGLMLVGATLALWLITR